MHLIISNATNQPIYEQIYHQIKGAILSEELHPGDPLPSIRTLAKDLRISVITTKRAYDELEKSGYLYTVPAKGSYVAEKNTELIREAHFTQIESHMRQIATLAVSCGLTEDTLVEMLQLILRGDGDERH